MEIEVGKSYRAMNGWCINIIAERDDGIFTAEVKAIGLRYLYHKDGRLKGTNFGYPMTLICEWDMDNGYKLLHEFNWGGY